MRSAIFVIFFVTAVAGSLVAQDPDPAADARAGAIKAIESLSKGAWRFTGKVGVREANRSGPSIGLILGAAGPGGARTPFKGAVELVRTADGDLLCVSESVLPGCAVFRHEDKYIKRSTNRAGKALDTDTLAGDVLSAMHVPHLLEKARKATLWKSSPSKIEEFEGMTQFSARLDLSLVGRPVPEPEGPMAHMSILSQPQVMQVLLHIQADASGKVAALGLEVLRSDPMATMQAFMEESGGMLDPAELEDFEPEEGARTMYDFRRADGQATKRATQALSTLRAAARK